ncbi:unnamed protein product, partial [Meganyctiphanes norvegica]
RLSSTALTRATMLRLCVIACLGIALAVGAPNYQEVIHDSFLFYEAQRSGKLPSDNRLNWRGDSALGDGSDVGLDLTGGYYDAGDFVKFGFPMAGSVTNLAWGGITWNDAYANAGELDYLKAAVKWGTDYFIRCHPEDTVFYGQVGNGDADHASWGRPEDMTMGRPSYKITADRPGSDLAGETSAAFSAAYMLFKDSDPTYAATCLDHAKSLYKFADEHRAKYTDSIPEAANFYQSWGGYNDELAWAAAWLAKATGDSGYLSDAEGKYGDVYTEPQEFSWDDKSVGVMTLLYELTGKSTYQSDLQNFCDKIKDDTQKTPGGLVFISQWGSLRYNANAMFILLQAAELGMKTSEYQDFARGQIGYILGEGSQRSFVIGYGNNPPTKPHHRSSSCDLMPAPCSWDAFNNPGPNPQTLTGALVGGVDSNDNYNDDRGDYVSNEVACDYNAAFTGAVAALYSLGM